MTFIIHFPDGRREQYSNRYDEHQRDLAFEDVEMRFPNCYIESF